MADESSPPAPPEVRLVDLRPEAGPVEVIGRVVTVQRREVSRRSDGSRRPLLSGLLSDGTGTVRFTWWDPPAEGIERGTVLRAVGAEVREFRGRAELTFTWKTRVAPASPAEIPPLDPAALPLRPVAELRPPAEGFRIEVRVVRMEPKTVSVGEERRVVYEGLLADATGAVVVSAWSDFGLKAGEALQITGGYLRSFRGLPQLVLDERSSVRRIDRPDLPAPAAVQRPAPRPIADVEDAGGGAVVAVDGIVVGLAPPSGLVYRCPTCRRSLAGGVCRLHGEVQGVADLRARIVLDDGTGSATIAAGREATEQLWGVDLAEALRRLQERPDPSLIAEQLLAALLGRRLRVRGAASRDDFGLTVHPETIERLEVDLESAAQELAARVGGA